MADKISVALKHHEAVEMMLQVLPSWSHSHKDMAIPLPYYFIVWKGRNASGDVSCIISDNRVGPILTNWWRWISIFAVACNHSLQIMILLFNAMLKQVELCYNNLSFFLAYSSFSPWTRKRLSIKYVSYNSKNASIKLSKFM